MVLERKSSASDYFPSTNTGTEDGSGVKTLLPQERLPVAAEPAPVINRFTRRASVCAEAYNPDEEEDDAESRIIHPKTDDQRNRLQEACKDILLFKNLDPEQMSQVLDAMFEKLVKEGEHVIDQGDDGDNFYVIDRGTFDIYVKCDGVGRCVGNYDNRGSFGELALMYNTPRAATITATSPGALWGLGDLADSFFIVESGEVKITMKRKGKSEAEENGAVEIARCSRGQYFGELALVTNKPRAASAHAIGTVKCLVHIVLCEKHDRDTAYVKDDLPELQAVQSDPAQSAIYQLSSDVSHQEYPRPSWNQNTSEISENTYRENEVDWLTELANIATSPQSPLMQCSFYNRSSPVHIIATSKSLHSYARPPPVSSSKGEPAFPHHHWKEQTPVRHGRVSLFVRLNLMKFVQQLKDINFPSLSNSPEAHADGK
ncbi:hypothetical protein E2I00_003055 [Balaenoptera physalus]|uniref:Cyclic nucleotide-binding domain-containing protein n=1 Tax=Balaenoptera physalus TaxID=9770 RepID=A0A6A1Q3Y4_BALPH|nr:hypothetical protein E2I00_003055 [Balaenoptera physalus]